MKMVSTYTGRKYFTESQLTNNTADTQLGTTLSARRSVFCNYLNLSKLSVNWVTTYGAAYPQELKYNSNQNGASNGGSLEKIDGKYQLQYILICRMMLQYHRQVLPMIVNCS